MNPASFRGAIREVWFVGCDRLPELHYQYPVSLGDGRNTACVCVQCVYCVKGINKDACNIVKV